MDESAVSKKLILLISLAFVFVYTSPSFLIFQHSHEGGDHTHSHYVDDKWQAYQSLSAFRFHEEEPNHDHPNEHTNSENADESKKKHSHSNLLFAYWAKFYFPIQIETNLVLAKVTSESDHRYKSIAYHFARIRAPPIHSA